MAIPMDFYPPVPSDVPPDLTTSSLDQKVRVFLVLANLVFFVLLYVCLVAGAGYLSYRFFAEAASNDPKWGPVPPNRGHPRILFAVLGVVLGLFFLFLVKGLLKWNRTDPLIRVKVHENEEPVLFEFIRQLCKDIRTPFPDEVYVTAETKTAVYYRESFLTLFVPPRKNLAIGLGLANQLNLTEFKAVLAYELGQFSQNGRLGNYATRSNRVVGDLLFRRDWLDKGLASLGRRPSLRLGVIVWAFTGWLWILRTCLQGLFRITSSSSEALSQQMVHHADLVAVSVTGSDALVHALVRLDFAVAALNLAWEHLAIAGDYQLYTRDLFYHQTRAAEHLRAFHKNARLGQPPALPPDRTKTVQVFPA
jgi:Zn-dependent protease with chaperone function